MAKKKKKSYHRSTTIPAAIVAPMLLVGAKTTNIAIYDGAQAGINHLTQVMTGFDMRDGIDFQWERMKQGTIPIALGFLVHKIAGKVGLNKALGAAGVPWIRI